MMSLKDNTSTLHAKTRRELVNNWFDKHPRPWEIDCHWFSFNDDNQNEYNIYVYFAENLFDWYQIRVKCRKASIAEYLNRLLYKTTSQMGIEQIWINKELFLLRSSF
tara:strand:- start:594 stop:914 length:321 start_codon:yes stop_codon:yes gene_type:complete